MVERNPDLQETIDQAMVEVKHYLAKQNRPSYPFRDRFAHTMRVLTWAERIHEIEGGDLDVITLAVLFHDAGWEEPKPHAQVSAELAKTFLLDSGLEPSMVHCVVSAVRNHNLRYKSDNELPIEDYIVMDSDLLDEIGVITLVWDALATAIEDVPSYENVLKRSQRYFQGVKYSKAFIKLGMVYDWDDNLLFST
jgi:uncharacterized protein